MRGVDHDPLQLAALARRFGENLVEHATAPKLRERLMTLVSAVST
jgi:hypothetical protein